jgi:hypothetical protein
MKDFENLRIFYHFAVLTIFLYQSKQSLNKYLEYPVVIQKSFSRIDRVEKPDIQVCYHTFFDYDKAAEFGYDWRSQFLAGLLPNSTKPSWKGKHGNSTFQKIQDMVYFQDFSNVNVSQPYELIHIFGKGFCLQIKGFRNNLTVTSHEKELKLKVYLVHRSTEKIITSDKESPYTQIVLGATSNTTFDYMAFEISYEVEDNTIFEGTKCIDYRQQKESLGDCNYKALATHFQNIYGCYPPWMKLSWKNMCERNVQSKNISVKTLKHTFVDLNNLHAGIHLHNMKQCLPPCYQVQVKWNKREHVPNWKGNTWLYVHDDGDDNVPIFKAVYSFDIFTLTVELGSALGLWLGINMLKNIKLEFKFFAI